jgi:hypothetical protein
MPVSTTLEGLPCRTSIVIERSRQLCEKTQYLIDQSDELIRQTQTLKGEFMRLRRYLDSALYPAIPPAPVPPGGC